MLKPPTLGLLIAAAVSAISTCGSEDENAALVIRVRSAANMSDALRAFNPANPPERVALYVLRSSNPSGDSVARVEVAWNELEKDPLTGRRFILVSVPANKGRDDPYLLRLGSIVKNPNTQEFEADACGAVGQIVAAPGAKVLVEIVAHAGPCQALCSRDSDCPNDHYCASFECWDQTQCAIDDDCTPAGAYCFDETCRATCSSTDDPCLNPAFCCGEICSVHCG